MLKTRYLYYFIFISFFLVAPSSSVASSLERNCQKGKTSACRSLGNRFFELSFVDKAIYYFKKGCERGDKKSCAQLIESNRKIASLRDQRTVLNQQKNINAEIDQKKRKRLREVPRQIAKHIRKKRPFEY